MVDGEQYCTGTVMPLHRGAAPGHIIVCHIRLAREAEISNVAGMASEDVIRH
jgi:hypothetical protein